MKSNVVNISEARKWRDFDSRLAQNALILNAAITDKRLNRDDLRVLSDLIDHRVYSNRIQCLKGRIPNQRLEKLIRLGYLDYKGLREGILGGYDKGLLMFELTERELSRDWFKENGIG